jgi:hypothetical protein
MAVYLVMTHEGGVVAVSSNYALAAFRQYGYAMHETLHGLVIVAAVRVNAFHDPLRVGEKFDPDKPGARIVDQLWNVGA